MNSIANRFLKCVIACCGVIILGSVGFAMIEQWSIGESFYMTIITMSTVGYGETRELSEVGRLFTCGLIVISIATMTLTTASFTSFLISNSLSGKFWKRRMQKMAARLKNHTIICGTGLISLVILDRLHRQKLPVVVVGDDRDEIEEIKRRFPDVPVIEGCPKSEITLADANVLRAKTVVATLDDEFDNLLISMTVKDLGKKIRVIARSENPNLSGRLKKAGIDHVICPFLVTGQLAADLIVDPQSLENDPTGAMSPQLS